jgi:hypothetical protein
MVFISELPRRSAEGVPAITITSTTRQSIRIDTNFDWSDGDSGLEVRFIAVIYTRVRPVAIDVSVLAKAGLRHRVHDVGQHRAV